MTNLRQRLQAWADRGVFKFPEGDDKGGFTMIKEDSYKPNIGAWELTPEQNFGIKCVLDGTIQVWRPVEHYPPPDNTILCLTSRGGGRIGSVEKEEDGYWLPTPESTFTTAVKIRHWMPIPPPPKEGE